MRYYYLFNLLTFLFKYPDSSFLLRFLRSKKFSVPITQESIERYLLLRQSYDGVIFQNMDMNLSPIKELIRLG